MSKEEAINIMKNLEHYKIIDFFKGIWKWIKNILSRDTEIEYTNSPTTKSQFWYMMSVLIKHWYPLRYKCFKKTS